MTKIIGLSGSLRAKSFNGGLLALLFALAAFTATGAQGQQKPADNREIFLYQGADRAQRLLANAKKEGALTLYSTMTMEDAAPLIAAPRRTTTSRRT